jgi:hypothetical protein
MNLEITREIADAYSILEFAQVEFGWALKKLDEYAQYKDVETYYRQREYKKRLVRFEIAASDVNLAKQRLADAVMKQLVNMPHSEIFKFEPAKPEHIAAAIRERRERRERR